MTSDAETPSSKMAAAAEALIKAANTHVESKSLALGQDTVDGLKKLSLDSASVQNSIRDLKASYDDKTNTLIQSINNLKKEIVSISKRQTLEWAIINSEIGSFAFYHKNHGEI
jgi:hypothetical protein